VVDVPATLPALIELIKSRGTGLLDLHGIGPSGAARLLVEVGDITRFHGRFASRTRTASIDAFPGDRVRHRLSRGEPADQPGSAHHGHRATAEPHEGRGYYAARSLPASPRMKPCVV
jgi:hypothetical protein